MFERETWEFVNTFAPWLSALGTLLAVITSLYLARRDRIVRLRISVGLRQLVWPGNPVLTDFITINVANVGHRSVTVTEIEWRLGHFRKKNFVQVPPCNPISASLPVKLDDGDEASFRFTLSEFEQGVSVIVKEIVSRRFRSVTLQSLRAGVSTSAGFKRLTSVEKPLTKWFAEQAARLS